MNNPWVVVFDKRRLISGQEEKKFPQLSRVDYVFVCSPGFVSSFFADLSSDVLLPHYCSGKSINDCFAVAKINPPEDITQALEELFGEVSVDDKESLVFFSEAWISRVIDYLLGTYKERYCFYNPRKELIFKDLRE